VSVDLLHPPPSPRPLIVAKANGVPPSLRVSARPSSAAPRVSVQEPIKAVGVPSIVKRRASAVRSVNR
jgi:hypothetical protein